MSAPRRVLARRCLLAVALCLVAIACAPQGRDDGLRLSAVFPRAQALYVGSEVRVLGVDVGHVTAVHTLGDSVRVDMLVDAAQPIPADVGAALTPVSLLGERVVTLGPPYTGGPKFSDGDTIPIERTAVPAEIDEVLRSFQAFAEALDERTLAELIDVSAATLEGQGSGLNTLIDEGADTVALLDRSSGDLNALVAELGRLNATLASRDEKLGRTLERLSVVLQTFSEESDDIIGSLDELARLTAELRPLVDEHTGPLIRDLDTLATTLSTLDRNIDRFPDLFANSRRLLTDLPLSAANYTDGGAKLNNKGEELVGAIELRTAQRLSGLCIRLEVDECSSASFWHDHLDEVTCLTTQTCEDGGTSLGDALASALVQLPEQAQIKLRREAQRAQANATREQRPRPPSEPVADEPLDVPEPEPTNIPLLPLPDPRLDTLELGGGG